MPWKKSMTTYNELIIRTLELTNSYDEIHILIVFMPSSNDEGVWRK